MKRRSKRILVKLAGHRRAIVEGGTLYRLIEAEARVAELEREKLELATWLESQRDLKRAAREKVHRQAALALDVILAQATEIQRLELLLLEVRDVLYEKIVSEQREKILELQRAVELALKDASYANRRYETLRGLANFSKTLLRDELAQTRSVSFTWSAEPVAVLRIWSKWLKRKDLASTENNSK